MAKPKRHTPSAGFSSQSQSPFSKIPVEVLGLIFSCLSLPELLSICRVCKLFAVSILGSLDFANLDQTVSSTRFFRRVNLAEFPYEAFPFAIKRLPAWMRNAGASASVRELIIRPGLPGRSSHNAHPPSPYYCPPVEIYPCPLTTARTIGSVGGVGLYSLCISQMDLNSDGLMIISDSCPYLHELELDNVTFNDFFPSEPACFKMLHTLKLTSTTKTWNTRLFGSNLRHLHLIHTKMTPRCWDGPGCIHYVDAYNFDLNKLKLESLSLIWYSNFSTRGMQSLKSLQIRSKLAQSEGSVPSYESMPSEAELASALQENKLTRLNLSSCRYIDMTLTSSFLSGIVSLDLTSTGVGNRGMYAIAGSCNKLVDLRIKGCRSITDDGVISVVKRLDLHVLIASGCNIGNESIHAITTHCPNLTKLHVSWTNCTDFAPLIQLPSLLCLHARGLDALVDAAVNVVGYGNLTELVADVVLVGDISDIPPAPIDDTAMSECRYCGVWMEAGLIDDHHIICNKAPRPCLLQCGYIGCDRHHFTRCELYRVVCKKCHRDVPRCDMEKHNDECHVIDFNALLHTCPLAWLGCSEVFSRHCDVIRHISVCPLNDRNDHSDSTSQLVGMED